MKIKIKDKEYIVDEDIFTFEFMLGILDFEDNPKGFINACKVLRDNIKKNGGNIDKMKASDVMELFKQIMAGMFKGE